MQIRNLFLLCAVAILSAVITTSETAAYDGKPPASEDLAAALQRGSDMPESPFQLQVNCTDQKGIRSFDLFAGGATIWNGRSQIMLPTAARSALLKTLIEQEFARFETRYGGRERPAKTAVAARISCRVWVRIEEFQKSSVQQAGGEQSTQLTKLAADLLDQVEQFAQNGVTPADLQGALDKLSDGQLAPQVLRLRFVDLPGKDNNKSGSILHLHGGKVSRQAYSPGHVIEEQVWVPLEQSQYQTLVTALQTAQPASLPGNLWSEDQLELEIRVLAHKKVVLARPFARLDPAGQGPAQQRFDTLLAELRRLSQPK